MNKQEAIEKIQNLEGLTILDKNINFDNEMISKKKVLNIIKQLDELVKPPEPEPWKPEKPVIPQFVAEWIKYCKSTKLTFLGAFHPVSEHGIRIADTFTEEVWKGIDWAKRNQDTFARAWLDGFEIEKEKLYTVEIPNPESVYPMILYKTDGGGVILGSCYTPDNWKKLEWNQLTESEIKQDFEWAFRWAKEVE